MFQQPIMLIAPLVLICCLLTIKWLRTESGSVLLDAAVSARYGAKIFLQNQNHTYSLLGLIVVSFIYYYLGTYPAIGFVWGLLAALLSSYFGFMLVTKIEPMTDKLNNLNNLPFYSQHGMLVGVCVISPTLISIIVAFFVLQSIGLQDIELTTSLLTLSFGASVPSILARLGGSVFVACINAFLYQAKKDVDHKFSEANVKVTNSVCITTDLCETFAFSCVATMLSVALSDTDNVERFLFYPLILSLTGILGSVAGLAIAKKITKSWHQVVPITFLITMLICAILGYFIADIVFNFNATFMIGEHLVSGRQLYYCNLVGLIVIGITCFSVQCQTNRLSLQQSNEQTSSYPMLPLQLAGLPILAIALSIWIAFTLAGLIGIAITTSSIVAFTTLVLALDINARRSFTLSYLSAKGQDTDKVKAIVTNSKSLARVYSIIVTTQSAFILLAIYSKTLLLYSPATELDLYSCQPLIILGFLAGILSVYLFLVYGVSTGHRCITRFNNYLSNSDLTKINWHELLNQASSQAVASMRKVALLPILTPAILAFVVTYLKSMQEAWLALGAMILGGIAAGLLFAIVTSLGPTVDKIIDKNFLINQPQLELEATYHDIAAPALTPMMKISSMMSLLLLLAFT